MSRSIDFSTHGSRITEVYNSVLNNDPNTSWFILTPSPNSSSLSYSPNYTGNGDINEFLDSFKDLDSSNIISFGFIRLKIAHSNVLKFLIIGYCPDTVSIKLRSNFNSYFNKLLSILNRYHIQVQIRDEDDLDPTELLNKVTNASGATYSSQPQSFSNSSPKKFQSSSLPTQQKKSSVPINKNQFIPKQSFSSPQKPSTSFKNSSFPIKSHSTSFNNKKHTSSDSDNDGWGDVEKVEERDLLKNPIKPVPSAYKPINPNKISSPKSIPLSFSPNLSLNSPKSSKFNNIDNQDLSDDEKKFKQKLNIFNSIENSESSKTSQLPQSKKLFLLPKPKIVNSVSDKFKPVQSAPSYKSYSNKNYIDNKIDQKDKIISGASRNFAASNGKTPAQIWAEKHGKYDSSFKSDSPVKSSLAENKNEIPSKRNDFQFNKISNLGNKFDNLSVNSTNETDNENTHENTHDSIHDNERVSIKVPIAVTSTNSSSFLPPPSGPSIPKRDNSSFLPPPPGPSLPKKDNSTFLSSPTSPSNLKSSGSGVSSTPQPPSSLPKREEPKYEEIDSSSEDENPQQLISQPPPPVLPSRTYQSEDPKSLDLSNKVPAKDTTPSVAIAAVGVAAVSSVVANTAVSSSSKNGNTNNIIAFALYDYDKSDEDEIEFKEGEKITEILFTDADWWQGKNAKGEVGVFPSAYVELEKKLSDDEIADKIAEYQSQFEIDQQTEEEKSELEPEEKELIAGQTETDQSCVAIYDYAAQEPNELSFNDGDKIINVEFIDDDWWLGDLKGQRKLFPANYVKLL
ncbi:uncharacterized protein ASCRUDRAFT_77051 [Ascoidea rubescens DSM 1968]|uniref:SH3 domain-containing protein n=1 Tax=Ascoidea rubescens DSM 1968 TaxID=1344418 RepID=A0A1D2VDC7_9ASCO|nr:hypothetical protein ASCRUDRAFT_77051 [Ascoidea rubescens DSM 1968]ODV59708.1 hypothetical protein ASCRUDRAFT_77051 [Ascoidea rubescens DSM 1968]